jgi:hypothetical protein
VIRWALIILLCGAGLWWAGRSAGQARGAARDASAALDTVRAQADELAALRAAVPQDRKPGSGLAARVSAALSASGLPASALSSLSPESGVNAGAGSTRQRATLVLAGATLPQIGAFLERWRSAEPAWVIASIELNPAQSPPPIPGADLPLRGTLGLEAVYIEATGEKP